MKKPSPQRMLSVLSLLLAAALLASVCFLGTGFVRQEPEPERPAAQQPAQE